MSNPYTGEIRMFGGNFAPQGWALCQGQIIPIEQNSALFNLIGTTYGGDGQTTFALPNLQSRVPVGVGTLSGNGMSFTLASVGGLEQVTLTVQQMPAHTHQPVASNGPGTLQSPANASWASSASDSYSATGPGAALAATAIGTAGGSQPHDNMLPFLCVNFIFCLFGIYPSA